MVRLHNHFYKQNYFPFCLSPSWLTAVDAACRSSHGHCVLWIKPSLRGFMGGLGSQKVLQPPLEAEREPQSRVTATSLPGASSSHLSPEQEVTAMEEGRQMLVLLPCNCSSLQIQAWTRPKEFDDVAWPQRLLAISWSAQWADRQNVLHAGGHLYQLLGKSLHQGYVETLGIRRFYRLGPQGPAGAVAPHYHQAVRAPADAGPFCKPKY